MSKQEKTHKTKDIFEASYIHSQNVKLQSLEPDIRYSWFVFEDKEKCERLSNDYWSENAEGNIKHFVNSYKTLKDLVFSRKRGD